MTISRTTALALLLAALAVQAWAQSGAEPATEMGAVAAAPTSIDAARSICDAHWIVLPEGPAKLDPALSSVCVGVYALARVSDDTPPPSAGAQQALPALRPAQADRQQIIDFLRGITDQQ